MTATPMSFKKDVLIEIKGIQNIDGEKDVIELFTCGKFYLKNRKYYISYSESESTGFKDSDTLLKVDGDHTVTMTRTGNTSSHLVIEKGRRHQCHYDTGYGMITVGISGDSIISDLSENGGKLDFSYSMDINSALTSENRVIITIKESDTFVRQ